MKQGFAIYHRAEEEVHARHLFAYITYGCLLALLNGTLLCKKNLSEMASAPGCCRPTFHNGFVCVAMVKPAMVSVRLVSPSCSGMLPTL